MHRLFTVLPLVALVSAWAPTGHGTLSRPTPVRSRAALLAVQSAAPDAEAPEQPAVAAKDFEGKVAPVEGRSSGGYGSDKGSINQQINQRLIRAEGSEEVLAIVEEQFDSLNAVNMATALHVVAARNKRKRARRDVVLRDRRFQQLVEKLQAHPRPKDFSPRSVSDILWSFATLQHWPPTLLKPVLTSVAVQLEKGTFEASHLSTVVWALAKLQCKPVRLLEQIEVQAAEKRNMGDMSLQNVANLLWGFAKLNYQPTALLAPLSAAVAESGMCLTAKPVEVADLAFALNKLGRPGEQQVSALLLALAERAAPGAALDDFSSRQLVALVACLARLDAAAALPEGRVEAWINEIKAAHAKQSLLAGDAAELERALDRLGIDGQWIKSSDMLNVWTDLAIGRARRNGRRYSDDELRTVFESIDTDKSGDIDRAELKAAIKQINPDADDDTVNGMLTFADADGDAQVSFDEFKVIISGVEAPAAAA